MTVIEGQLNSVKMGGAPLHFIEQDLLERLGLRQVLCTSLWLTEAQQDHTLTVQCIVRS